MCHYQLSNCDLCLLHAMKNAKYYIIDETTEFASHKCHEHQIFMWLRPFYFIMTSRLMSSFTL